MGHAELYRCKGYSDLYGADCLRGLYQSSYANKPQFTKFRSFSMQNYFRRTDQLPMFPDPDAPSMRLR